MSDVKIIARNNGPLRIEGDGPRYFLLVNQTAPAFGGAAPGRDYAAQIWKAVGPLAPSLDCC